MKTQNLNSSYASPMTFCAYQRDASTMSKKMFDLVSRYPAIDKFGKKYDATIGVGKFLSTKDITRQQLSLVFENIKPKSIFGKIKNYFSPNPPVAMRLKTRATNEEEFLAELANLHTDTLFKIYAK